MYTNYSKMGTTPEEQVPEQSITLDHSEHEPTIVEETNLNPVLPEEPESPVLPEEPESPELLLGIVKGCTKLNVRAEPNGDADVLTTLSVSSEVMIDETESTEDFYKVCTASGMEGYCMKRFITIQ